MLKITSILAMMAGSLNVMAASSDIPLKREFPFNEKLNPCENLYEYACSKTIESFVLRPDRRKHTFAFNDSAERILEFKKKTIKDLVNSTPDNPIAGELKGFYQACMNEGARAKEETQYVKNKLAELDKIKTKKEWMNAQVKRIHTGNAGIIGYYSVDNFDDPKKSDLLMAVGYSILPEKSYAKNEELLKGLEVVVTDFFKTIGVNNPEAHAKVVLKYEIDQQDSRLFPAEARILYSRRNFTTKKEMLKNYKELALKPFLDEVPKQTLIRVLNKRAMPFLNRIVKTYSLDDLKTIEMFYELSGKLDKGYPAYFNEMFAFRNKYLGGKNKRSELDEECTEIAMGHFGPEFDYLVLPKMFPNFSSKKVADLVDQIKKSILNSLSKNAWLTPEAKKEAQRKISTAYMRLVSPEKYEDWKFLPVIAYNPETFIANGEKRNDLVDAREFGYFKKDKDIRSWEGVHPLEVNAFYQASYNQFTMLQGILQYPFYDQTNDIVENLAGVGMIVGHELGHGIDDQGSRYDADGKLRDWMTPQDLAKFKELTKSLIEQYGKAGMNGELTLGENIGDLVGLTAAYDAAFDGTKLSGDDLKKEQRKFFLSYARSWCEVQLPGVRELRLKSDPHSLGVARTNEVVKHFGAFKEAFNCKDTDPMILPVDKRVHIW